MVCQSRLRSSDERSRERKARHTRLNHLELSIPAEVTQRWCISFTVCYRALRKGYVFLPLGFSGELRQVFIRVTGFKGIDICDMWPSVPEVANICW